MKKPLTFTIEDLPLSELWEEWDVCRRLARRIAQQTDDLQQLYEKLCVLWDELVRLNIAIFCQYYKAGELGGFIRNDLPGHGIRDMCADEIEELQMSTRICRVLADLDVPKIEASKVLSDLYHRLRLMVDEYRGAGKFYFYNPMFWDLYFRFYYAYTDAEQAS